MNIIELQPELDHYPEDWHEDIHYFNTASITDLIEKANSIYRALGKEERTALEMLRKWTRLDKSEKELVDELKEWHIDTEEWENYETLEDFMDEDPDYYLHEIFGDDIELIEEFMDVNGLKFGTVGYSPWSYYLAAKDIDESYILDLYEGWNFYSLASLDSEGEVIDSIGFIYLGDDSYTLEDAVKEHFGYENFYLVNNDYTQYFEHKKVEKVAHTTYTFKEV